MIKIRKCKKHGNCNSCGQQQTESNIIWEIRASITEQGWNTMMLCDKCIALLQEVLAEQN